MPNKKPSHEYLGKLRELERENEGLRHTLALFQAEADRVTKENNTLKKEINDLKKGKGKPQENKELLGKRAERYIPLRADF